MLFDDVLCQIGEYGIYQVMLYALLGLVAIPTGWQEFATVFVAGDQNHWCHVPRLENFTHEEQRCLAIPDVRDDCQRRQELFLLHETEHLHPGAMSAYSRCHQFDLDFSQFSDLQLERWNRTKMVNSDTKVKPCTSWVFETSPFRSTLASDMELVCDNAHTVAYVQIAYHSGFMAGSVIFGAISDRFGRHKTLILALFLQIIFGVSAAITPVYPVFLTLRFLDGTSVAGAFNTAFVMIMEMIGPSRRMAAGIFVQGWYAFGIMILSGIAYAVRSQKKLQCMLSLPVAFLLIYYWIIPESPRWFASHGQFTEAEGVLRRMAAVNGRELPDTLQLEENQKEHDTSRLGRNPNILDLFLTKNLRIKTCILHCICFADAFVYHACVSHMGPVSGNMYLTVFLSGAVELPVFIVCLAIINRVGRRWPLVVIMAMLALVSLLCIPFLQNPDHMPALTALSMMGKLVAAAGFASVNVFSAETFPTTIRNTGIGLGSMCSGLGGLLARQTSRADVYPPVPMIMAAALCTGGAILAFLLPETTEHNLPESLIEGEQFGKECISNFLKTKDIHKSFITEREPHKRLELSRACSLKMGNLKMEHQHIPQSI